jgi:hypothetical protein
MADGTKSTITTVLVTGLLALLGTIGGVYNITDSQRDYFRKYTFGSTAYE